MSLLKGNFEAKKTVEDKKTSDTLEEKFEREALANLGGSIAYVARKKFIWTGDDGEEKEMSAEGRAEQYDSGRDRS
jgi:hypothetical protein